MRADAKLKEEDKDEKVSSGKKSGSLLNFSLITSLIQEQKSQLVEIEYLLINMPKLLTVKPRLFIEIV